jgi:glycosyltransferase 2 family protein
MRRPRPAVLLALKACISVTLLALALRAVGARGVALHLKDLDVAVALLATIPQIIGVLAMATRWRLLSLGLLTPLQALRYTFIGMFYGAVLPGAISGDVAKGAAVAWKDRSTRTAVLPASILADRLIGIATLAVFFTISCVLLLRSPAADHDALARMAVIGLAGSGPILLLASCLLTRRGRSLVDRIVGGRLPPAIRAAAVQLLVVADEYRTRSGLWGRAVLLSVVVQVCNVAFYLIVLHALGMAVPLYLVVVLYSVLSILVLIPISISGFGVREWFTLLYFPAIGLAADAGIAFALTSVALSLIIALIGVGWQLIDFLPSRIRHEGVRP